MFPPLGSSLSAALKKEKKRTARSPDEEATYARRAHTLGIRTTSATRKVVNPAFTSLNHRRPRSSLSLSLSFIRCPKAARSVPLLSRPGKGSAHVRTSRGNPRRTTGAHVLVVRRLNEQESGPRPLRRDVGDYDSAGVVAHRRAVVAETPTSFLS